jgi:hypothetical protein
MAERKNRDQHPTVALASRRLFRGRFAHAEKVEVATTPN